MVRAWSAIDAGDRLPDPPRRIGREFVAAAIFELIDGLHQADIAFLDQIKELQAAVRVFLGDGDHEAQIGLDHLLLRLARLALALLHDMHDAAELGNFEAGLGGEPVDLGAQLLHEPALVMDEIGPAALLQAADAAEPVRVELVALILVEEVVALDAVALGEAEQPAFEAEQALVDVVERLDQALDAVLVERERLDLGDDLVLEHLVALLLPGGERVVLQRALDDLVLQLAELLVVGGDEVEGLEHLRLELGLHGGERKRVLEIVFVVLEFLGLGLRLLLFALARGLRLGAGLRGRLTISLAAAVQPFGQRLRGDLLGVGALIGGFEVDDVAEQDLPLVQLVAPDDDGLEGERALAKPCDHGLAAGLDALRNGDLALAGKKLDRAHLAQIHAYGVVGTLGRFLCGLDLGNRASARSRRVARRHRPARRLAPRPRRCRPR